MAITVPVRPEAETPTTAEEPSAAPDGNANDNDNVDDANDGEGEGDDDGGTSGGSDLQKRTFLVGAIGRGILSLVAIPLAPVLYRHHAAVLVFLRPTKEVFLFGGFVLRQGDAWLPAMVLAALPMHLVGVWIFFGLGRAYAEDLSDQELPGMAGRLLPKRRVDELRGVLDDRGTKVVFLGRIAVFPSSLMAAAAGAAEIGWKRFLLADLAGALVGMSALLGLGFALGEAYETAGPWVTAAGVVALVALAFVLGRNLLKPRRASSPSASLSASDA